MKYTYKLSSKKEVINRIDEKGVEKPFVISQLYKDHDLIKKQRVEVKKKIEMQLKTILKNMDSKIAELEELILNC